MLVTAFITGTACCLQFSGKAKFLLHPSSQQIPQILQQIADQLSDLIQHGIALAVDTYDGVDENYRHYDDDDHDKFLIAGLCYSGMEHEVDWLIKYSNNNRYQLLRGKIIGYASSGRIDLIEEFKNQLKKEDEDIRIMIYVLYIRLSQMDKLNAALNNATESLTAAKSFLDSKLFIKTNKNILNLLAAINDKYLRKGILDYLIKNYTNIYAETIWREAEIINKIMHEYQISFTSAYALRQKNASLWLLQGQQITQIRPANKQGIKLPPLPKEIYNKITAFFLNLPDGNVEELTRTVHSKLYAFNVNQHAFKYANSLFRHRDQFKTDLDDEEKRYKKRRLI